jgi:outer membrane protein assembly factor BamB
MNKVLALLFIQLFFGCTKSAVDANNPSGPNGNPVIVNNDIAKTIFLVSQNNANGNNMSYLTAYDVNGTIKWRKDSIGNIATDPVYSNGVIYITGIFVNSTSSHIENLHAIDANTGKNIWTIAGSPYYHTWIVPRNDTLYCTVSRRGVNFQNYLLAYDSKTGAELWKAPSAGAYYGYYPKLDGNVMYYISHELDARAAVVAYDFSSKIQKWQTSIGYNVADGPSKMLVVDNLVFIKNGTGGLRAIDKNTGAVTWSKSGEYNQPVYGTNLIYSVEKEFGLIAFEPFNGNQRWIWKPEGRYFGIETSYYSSDHLFSFVSDSTSYYLTSLDSKSGKLFWKKPVHFQYNSPIVVGNTLYAVRREFVNNFIMSFDANSGMPKDSIPLSGWIFGELRILTASGKFLELNLLR